MLEAKFKLRPCPDGLHIILRDRVWTRVDTERSFACQQI